MFLQLAACKVTRSISSYMIMLLRHARLHASVLQETRMFFSTTFFRVATPYREMSWADFLLADILTSLAKPLSDCERALCHLLSGPVMLPHSTDQVSTMSGFMMEPQNNTNIV